MPGVTTTSGSSSPTSTTSAHLGDHRGRGGGHHRPEVAGGLAVDEVAHPVRPVRTDQRDVAADRVLQDVGASVDLPRLLALGERRADAGRAEERADPGTGRAHPLGEVALRHHLELDLAVAVEPVEDPGVGLPRERADHLAHPALGQQRGQPGVAVAGVVGHDGQVGRALLDQRVDQRDRHARPCRTRRPAPSSRPRSRRPPRPRCRRWSRVTRRSPARRRAPDRRRCRSRPRRTGRRTRAAARPGCRGSGRRTHRAGGRSRSRRPWR